MLATRWTEVTSGPGWVHEVKWDGVRAIASGDGAIRSRNGNRIEDGYPELAGAVPKGAVLDGEIVALGSDGRPSFQVLQGRMHVRRPAESLVRETPATLMVFDLLYLDEPLTDRPWEERRSRLEALDLAPPLLVTDLSDDGEALFRAVIDHDLEGIVSKRRQTPYRPGKRSDDWRKVAHRLTCEVVVIGSVAGTGSRHSTFGSLALGLWDGDVLRFVGSVGSGFDDATLGAVDAALADMWRPHPPPMADDPVVPRAVSWVEPMLVAVVEYASWTTEGRLRAPVFKGFSATPVDEVTWQREGPR